MAITINGTGTITGISAGGLPDAIITTSEVVDLNITPEKLSQKLTSGTAVASTSGTSIDFNSIPSWVKRITVMFNGVSLSGTSSFLIQIGAGSIDATSYISQSVFSSVAVTTSGVTSTTGFGIFAGNANSAFSGHNIITNISGNTWISSANMSTSVNTAIVTGAGNKTLGGTLDRVRITTVNGTDTFDAGSINIMYEG